MPFDEAAIREKIALAAKTVAGLARHAPAIARLADEVRGALARGGRVYACGNGGSAAEAMHLTEELIGRYKAERKPFAAVCLNTDPTALTCIANDYGFERVFSRQVEALCNEGDVLVVFSTSGDSGNIRLALEAARSRRTRTIGLLGKGGGACAPLCDVALVVDSNETEHIQEAHQVIVHLILEAVEA